MKKIKEYLLLFLTMLKIGLFTFGGGSAMIALLENEFVAKKKWLEKEEFLDMAAIAESTPGPIAVNMATFVGSSQGGVLGAFLATLGVVLPSFVLILIIAALIRNLMKYAGVKAFLIKALINKFPFMKKHVSKRSYSQTPLYLQNFTSL